MRLPLLLVLALTLPARAELPPQAYLDMQGAAPEAVRLRMTSVDRAFTQGRTDRAELVRATAEVLEVSRTATELTTGREIALRYVHDPLPEDVAGPGPVPIVQRTAEYQAFLRADDQGGYAPAARKASFRQLAPPRPSADDDTPERVSDFASSPAYLGGLGALLLLVLGGLAAFLRKRRGDQRDQPDPEEDMATQFRVAPVLREPED